MIRACIAGVDQSNVQLSFVHGSQAFEKPNNEGGQARALGVIVQAQRIVAKLFDFESRWVELWKYQCQACME